MDKTLIIVLHYGDLQDTIACLDSIQGIEGPSWDTLVINNGQGREIAKNILESFPWIKYLEMPKNMGFARANNKGLVMAQQEGYRYSLILNNDVVVDPSFLKQLVACMESDTSIALAGPLIFHHNDPEKIWAMGGAITLWKARLTPHTRRVPSDRNELYEVDYLPGACVLIRNSILQEIGYLPETYLLAYEEAEFALRARKVGYRVVVCPNSVIWHKVGMSGQWPPKYRYNLLRNRFLFLNRNIPTPFSQLLVFSLLVLLLAGRRHPIRLILLSFFDHIRYSTVTLEHLERIQVQFNGTENISHDKQSDVRP